MRLIKKIFKYNSLLALLLIVACSEPYKGIDYQEIQKQEQELLEEFLKSEQLDTLKKKATLIKDEREDLGLYYFELTKGTGDSATLGKEVSFRFNYYQLVRDTLDAPFLAKFSTNLESDFPATYIVGTNNKDVLYTPEIDLGIRYMNLFGKSFMIITTGIEKYYATIVAEIEITAMKID